MEEILLDCIKDSPKFRLHISEQEKQIDSFEGSLEKLLKQCDAVQESAKIYHNANTSFMATFQSMISHYKEDENVQEIIGTFVQTFASCQNNYNIALENCNTFISRGLTNFLKTDVKRLRELRRHFLKISDELESALVKNAQAYKSRDQDCEETSNQLQLVRNNFAKAAMDYLFEINSIQMKKRTEILNMISNYIQNQGIFFQQNSQIVTNFVNFSNHVTGHLQVLQKQYLKERQIVREQIALLLKKVESQQANGKIQIEQPFCENTEIRLEGYLFKRTSNAFKSWVSRRWFILEKNQLYYNSQQQDTVAPGNKKLSKEKSQVVLEPDLRLCNTSPHQDAERRFCFQIISPSKTHLLQADSEEECQAWMRAIQESSRRAINVSHPQNDHSLLVEHSVMKRTSSKESFTQSLNDSTTFSKLFVDRILSTPGNMQCCDCGQTSPRWASINFGITLCIECSGIHRSFGVHRSKVRSVNLDAWDEEDVKVMQRLGNKVVNEILEACVDEVRFVRASPSSNRSEREAWIRSKYIDKSFIKMMPNVTNKHHSNYEKGSNDSSLDVIKDVKSNPLEIPVNHRCLSAITQFTSELQMNDVNSLLIAECLAANLPNMLRLLMFGADANCCVRVRDIITTPLIQSVYSGDMSPIEFLLLNGAKVDGTDSDDQTPLHHASMTGHAGQICLLLKRKANQYLLNKKKQDPLQIAVDKADANVVTILRLARLNEEMRGPDFVADSASDDFFTEVYRDFSSIDETHKT